MNGYSQIVFALFIIVILLLFLPIIVWKIRYPFLFLNYVQWFLMSPAQHLIRNYSSNWGYRFYIFLFPFRLVYGAFAYIFLLPLRLINAVYFNIVLYLSIISRDTIADIVKPGHDSYRHRSGLSFGFLWISLLPLRFIKAILIIPLALIQSILTVAFDTIWPTLTMFHGTDYEHAATSIARSGTWYVGSGNYAGTGIYFGLTQHIAKHYSRNARGTPCIIVVRATLFVSRAVSTLRESLRSKIGYDGDFISRNVHFPYACLVHWRHDLSNYEICLIQRSSYTYINTWRVRPLCIINCSSDVPLRVYGGLSIWMGSGIRVWLMLILTFFIYVFVFIFLFS